MTLNHNYGCFSSVGSGIAGNYSIGATKLCNLLKMNRLINIVKKQCYI